MRSAPFLSFFFFSVILLQFLSFFRYDFINFVVFRGCFAAACLLAFAGLWGFTVAQLRLCEEYTPTVDGGRCTPEDTSCEFKLVVTRKFAMTKADGTKLFVDNYKVYRSGIICMKYV